MDGLGLKKFHYRLITVAGAGILFDSFDVGILAFVLAALIPAWHIGPKTIGLIGSVSLAGMALGAVTAGWLADRFGRRRLFMATLVIYGLGAGLSGLSLTVGALLLFRGIAGFGLGGELPVSTTLVSEFLPNKFRGRGLVLLESWWAVGWLAAAVLAYTVIPRYGWRAAVIIGCLPALYVFYLRRHIPESPRFLLTRGQVAEARRVVGRVLGVADDAGEPDPRPAVRRGPSALLQATVRQRTLVLWTLWAGLNFAYYGMFLWLPSVLVEHGYTEVHSFEYTVLMTSVQLPGYWSAAWLIERVGRKPVLVGYLVLSALAAAGLGSAHSVTAVLVFGGLLSFFNLGAWGVVYAYTVEQYPTAVRATGAGWAMGIGRLGGIAAPFLVGLLLSESLGIGWVFRLFMATLLGLAVIVGVWGRETRGRSLEDVNLS